jgi:EAL domain-containing protein (putative c-di-GMP-specific phosphodiesterase class I)/ActR/RegA family two-component response regulator
MCEAAMNSGQRVMVLDDETDSSQFVADVAQAMGLSCVATTDPMRFLECLTTETTLIFLDLVMPNVDGVEMLRMLGQRGCNANIILMSGADPRILETVEEMAGSLGLSIVGHLQKPVRLKELEAAIETHLELRSPCAIPRTPRVIIRDADLRRAVERDQFELHFQPQIEIATGRAAGVEALVRWQFPGHGLIFPDDFIGRAEELGLIDELGWLVAKRGLQQAERFEDEAGPTFRLSLNVSVHSLHDLKFPDILSKIVQGNRIPMENVTLEITESGLIQELSGAHDVLARLRLKGVQLSVDDFGTGYSMMGQLRNIPATELKIDRSFVWNMHGNDGDRVMVQKTIEIGHELGMKVVAEGVETLEQLHFLRSYGCDVAQGYFFSRPLPAQELLEWLKGYRSQQSN